MGSIISNSINAYFKLMAKGNNRPVFFGIVQSCPQLHVLDRHFEEIKAEWEGLNIDTLPGYHQVDPYQTELAQEKEPDENWQVFLLQAMGATAPEALEYFPKTLELIKRVPQVFQAFFSVLPPGKSIEQHSGSFLGYLRYHLGIVVPDHSPPQLHIHNATYTWKLSESILFDDSWPHAVQNTCSEKRVILVVDILRPMPFPASWLNRFLLFPVIKIAYGRSLLKRFNKLIKKQKHA